MYIFISLLVFAISYCLFKKAAGSLDIRQLNMGAYVFYTLFVMAFIASIGILYHLEPPGYIAQCASLRLFGWMIVMYTMIMLPLGMLLACMIFKIKSMRVLLLRYQSSPFMPQFVDNDASFKMTLYFFSILSVLSVGYIIISQGASVPFWNLLTGVTNYNYLMQLRRSSGLQIKGHPFVKNYILLQASFTSVMAYTSYVYWRIKKKRKYLIWFSCLSLVVAVFALSSLVKSPILYFLLGLVLTQTMIAGKIKIKKIFILMISFFFLVGALSIFFQGTFYGTGKAITLLNILSTGVKTFYHRAIYVQLVCSYMCFDIFPRLHPHLWFSTTGRFIHDMLGLTYNPNYGLIVMHFFRPQLVAAGTAGHATTIFIGEAWANFGILGVLISPLWIGFFIQAFNIFFLKLKKTPFNLALYIQFTILIPITSGIIGFYYPCWIFEYLVIIFMVFIFASILKSAHKKSLQVKKPTLPP